MSNRKHHSFRYTLIALIAAILIGAMLRFLFGAPIARVVVEYVLAPVKTMYLNALKLVVAPVVFFMISASVAGITDYKAYGRIGGKVIGFYMMTSVLAICLSIGLAMLLQPGAGTAPGEAVYTSQAADISLRDTIIGIVPSNLLQPFLDGNMIQIIFLAVLIGAASGLLAQKADIPQFRKALELCNRLFRTVASFVLCLIPLGTFCAVAQLLLELDTTMILGLLNLIGTVFLAAASMLFLYGLLFFVCTKNSPFRLLRKCLPNLISFAMLCSTSAVMPQTLRTCTEELGIHPKISSFSMPLGSTMNMDGACIYLPVATIFLAELYGVALTPAILVQMGFTTLLLSVGAPPIPGAGFVCLSVLVLQLGIPMDAIGILLGIDQLMSMCRTVVNGSGDFVGTAIIAHSENEMDLSVFRK